VLIINWFFCEIATLVHGHEQDKINHLQN
jgi:hypothetical protein